MLLWYCRWRNWWARQNGTSMVEYAVLAAIIIIGLFASIGQLRDAIKAMFDNVTKILKTAPTA